MGIDLDGPEPLYRQVAEEIERRIDSGEIAPGRRVPSATEICEEFGVSRRTANEALAVLKERGKVRAVVGRGTFALDPKKDDA